MNICFVGPANSAHIKKWCNWFIKDGHEVSVISFIDDQIENVNVYYVNTGAISSGSDIGKLRYLLSFYKIKKIIKNINPDIVNAHYASSYGAVLALTGIKKYVVSIWGSDIYDFPKKSIFHKLLLKFSLWRATYIFSTSKAMADEANKYTDKDIEITPFGVDIELFNPNKRTRNDSDGRFIVGTVKALSDKYGIRYLLQAVAKVRCERPDIPIELRIAGKGPQEHEYKTLAEKLGIFEITKWLGFISQEDAAREWANMDIAVIASTAESFGVSAVEAQASGVPVIISDIPGLMEATKPGQSSIIVPRKNYTAIAENIIELYYNDNFCKSVGQSGRKFVLDMYELNMCFQKIHKLFENITNKIS